MEAGVLSGWTKVGTRSNHFDKSAWGFGVSGYAATEFYDYTALEERVKKKTLGQFDGTLATFFITKVNLEGSGTYFADTSKIAEYALPTFKESLQAREIANVRPIDPSEPLPSIEGADSYEYTGRYALSGIQKEVTINGVGTRTLALPSKEIQVTGLVIIWKEGKGTAFVAGGAFPAENYAVEDTISATGGETGDGIDISVSVDLNIRPDQVRRRVISLIKSV